MKIKQLYFQLFIYLNLEVLRKAISKLLIISTKWNNYKNNYILKNTKRSILKKSFSVNRIDIKIQNQELKV